MKSFCAFFVAFLWVLEVQSASGWQQIKPGGDTLCAKGSEYSFLVRRGDPQKVLVSFAGGGACWDDFTCDSTLIFTDTAEKTFKQVTNQSGIYDFNNVKNPYKKWTHIFVPYCTGDVHIGESDTVYTRPDNTSFTVHHRGSTNVKAVLKWLYENYKTAQEINIDGCSAGSYGSILWTPYIAKNYPFAKILQFGDSGAGVSDTLFFPQWQMQKSLPSWIPELDPAQRDLSQLSIVDIYKSIANYYPNARFSQFNHHEDRVQILYYSAMGGEGWDWSSRMFNNMQNISVAMPNFKYFIAPGKKHCLSNNPALYTTTVDQVSLIDWLGKKISGQDVENVKCTGCNLR